MSTPTNPQRRPIIRMETWLRVVRAVLEFQSGNCHFGSSPRHLLGLIQSEHPAYREDTLSCMQEGDQEEEPLVLLYQIPLRRLVAWNKWWHITARKLLRTYQRRYWGLVGNYLKTVTGVVNPHLAQARTDFRSRTRPAVAAAEQHCP